LPSDPLDTDLLRVRKVEVAADGAAEAALENRGEARMSVRARKGLAHGVGRHAGHERRRQPRRQIDRLQRKVHPPPAQPDAAVAGPVEQVVAEQGADVGHHRRRTDRMEPMAAEVDRDAVDDEAPGIAADRGAPLEQGD
jgi:hypothetical protein